MGIGLSGNGVQVAPGVAAAGVQFSLLFLGQLFIGYILFHSRYSFGIDYWMGFRSPSRPRRWVYGLHPGTTFKIHWIGGKVKEKGEIIFTESNFIIKR